MHAESNVNAAINAVLIEHEPATATEIAAEIDEHPVTVQRHCRQLQREDRIIQVVGGGYVRVGSETPFEQVASD